MTAKLSFTKRLPKKLLAVNELAVHMRKIHLVDLKVEFC